MVDNRFNENEIAYVIQKKESTDLTWVEIADSYNKKFKKNRSFECIKKCYQRYKNYFQSDDNHIRSLKSTFRTKKNNSYTAKENRVILDQWMKRDDLLDTIKNTMKEISFTKYKFPKITKSKGKKNMTLELLFSDIHYGKYVDGVQGNFVNLEIIKKRVRKTAQTVIKEIHRESKSFNVEKIVIAMLGDMIENADFHGAESAKGCEFSTSRQMSEAIKSTFHDLILPIAATGIKIHIPCLTGNHDRIGKDKTYVNPGEDNLSYVIYDMLRELCKVHGLKNVTFDIVKGLYTYVDVYDDIIVYEHGDELKNLNRDTMSNKMSKRQSQIGKVVHFYRIGHWHEFVCYGQGRMMCNGSVPGQDMYADSKGFDSEALQILNYYVETKKRSTSFFRTFPIYLEDKDGDNPMKKAA